MQLRHLITIETFSTMRGQYYSVLHSTTPYYKVLHRTTNYYSVLQSTTPY